LAESQLITIGVSFGSMTFAVAKRSATPIPSADARNGARTRQPTQIQFSDLDLPADGKNGCRV